MRYNIDTVQYIGLARVARHKKLTFSSVRSSKQGNHVKSEITILDDNRGTPMIESCFNDPTW